MKTSISHRIADVFRYIEENAASDLNLQKLARKFFISPFHLHRLFKATAGETLADYVERIRLSQAIYLLRYSPKTIADIALSCGWKNHATMTRAFARRLKKKPSAIRIAKKTIKIPPAQNPAALPILSIERKKLPAMYALTLPLFRSDRPTAQRWRALLDAGLQAGLYRNGPPRVLAYYRHARDIDGSAYDLAIEGESRPGFTARKMPAGKYLTGTYEGDPRFIGMFYDRLYAQVIRHDLKLAPALPCEIFLRYPPFSSPDRCRIMLAIPLI